MQIRLIFASIHAIRIRISYFYFGLGALQFITKFVDTLSKPDCVDRMLPDSTHVVVCRFQPVTCWTFLLLAQFWVSLASIVAVCKKTTTATYRFAVFEKHELGSSTMDYVGDYRCCSGT
jgi:hypothetical protein